MKKMTYDQESAITHKLMDSQYLADKEEQFVAVLEIVEEIAKHAGLSSVQDMATSLIVHVTGIES